MTNTPYPRDVADRIRKVVIYEGLELEELGIELGEIDDDTPLFDADGLSLDSVDALEVIAGVQREFGVTFPDVNGDFITEHASTVGRLAATVTRYREPTPVA